MPCVPLTRIMRIVTCTSHLVSNGALAQIDCGVSTVALAVVRWVAAGEERPASRTAEFESVMALEQRSFVLDKAVNYRAECKIKSTRRKWGKALLKTWAGRWRGPGGGKSHATTSTTYITAEHLNDKYFYC